MVNEKSVAKIAELVDDAVAKGAKLLLGGQRLNRPGYYYPPTVLSDVPDNADMMKEEIFGPVVSLQSFEDEAEAIRKANDTEYGLAAYVYTQDLKRGMQICEKLEAGMLGLNRGSDVGPGGAVRRRQAVGPGPRRLAPWPDRVLRDEVYLDELVASSLMGGLMTRLSSA